MTWDQITIALFGALAAWLSQTRTDSLRRWACIFGMLGQPGWFYAAWTAGQWGIFTLCVIYCGAWMHGIWIHWINPTPETVPGDSGVGTIQIVPANNAFKIDGVLLAKVFRPESMEHRLAEAF